MKEIINSNKGFSLVELLIAMGITGIFLTALVGVFLTSSSAFTTQNVTTAVQQTARNGIDFMVRDIRLSGLDPTHTRLFGIESASGTSIRFTSDRNENGAIDDADPSDGIGDNDLERIVYEFIGNDRIEQVLRLNDGSEVLRDTLIENVENLTFTYIDMDGNTLADPVPAIDLERIVTVTVSLTVTEPAGRRGTVSRTLNTQVLCRNLSF